MNKNKNISNLLQRNIGEIQVNVTEKDVFTSFEFHSFMNAIVFSLTEQMCQLDIVYDPQNKDVAYTNGDKIFLNAANELSSGYVALETKAACLAGIVAHECAHKLYLDFDRMKKANQEMLHGYMYNGVSVANSPLTPEEAQWKDGLETALQNPAFRDVMRTIYHHIDNIVADAHDEASLCRDFDGIGPYGLKFSTDALRRELPPLEELEKQEPLTVAFQLMLEFARYREIIALSQKTTDENEVAQAVISLSPILDEARRTDNYDSRASLINRCILHLWPYIEDVANEQQNQGGGIDDNNASNGNGHNNASNPPQQGNGDSQGAPLQLTPEILQKIKQQLEQGSQGGTATPKGSNAQQPQMPSAKQQNETGSESEGNDAGQGNTQAEEKLKELMDQLQKAVKKEKQQKTAEKNAENIQTATFNAEVNAASQTSPHKGRPVSVHRESNITDADKRQYDSIYAEVKQCSQQMQKKVATILEDLREGSVEHHRSYGKLVEARDGYRPDGKFFAKKKLPQEMPDMAVAVLMDQSGSMYGERINTAIKAAILLDDFATGLNLPVMVAGHNTATCNGTDIYVHTMFDRLSDRDKYRIVKAKADGSNRDGMAINIIVDQLYKRPEDVKMLVIISDGQPNANCYGGADAEKDIQAIIAKARTKGVQVFAAAIGSDKEKIERIYGEGFLDVSDLASLPKTMARLISKRII